MASQGALESFDILYLGHLRLLISLTLALQRGPWTASSLAIVRALPPGVDMKSYVIYR